jgi:demethoxyubiquinone hydroxylase (CLK1/Coq7/Cat5 family)
MRINHVGEVCAQALYYGQSVVAKYLTIKEFLLNSAKSFIMVQAK